MGHDIQSYYGFATENQISQFLQRKPPREPQQDDCCQGGCEHCVWNSYLDASKVYKDTAKAIKKGGVHAELLQQAQHQLNMYNQLLGRSADDNEYLGEGLNVPPDSDKVVVLGG